eukprot:s11_g32.t1
MTYVYLRFFSIITPQGRRREKLISAPAAGVSVEIAPTEKTSTGGQAQDALKCSKGSQSFKSKRPATRFAYVQLNPKIAHVINTRLHNILCMHISYNLVSLGVDDFGSAN